MLKRKCLVTSVEVWDSEAVGYFLPQRRFVSKHWFYWRARQAARLYCENEANYSRSGYHIRYQVERVYSR